MRFNPYIPNVQDLVFRTYICNQGHRKDRLEAPWQNMATCPKCGGKMYVKGEATPKIAGQPKQYSPRQTA